MADEARPVVEATDGQAKPGTEGTDARKADDLDTLLAEFAAGTKSASKPETKTATTTASEDVGKRVETLEKRLAEREFQTELQPILKRIRGDISPEVLDDSELADLLDGRAKRDPRLADAWMNRHQNPKAWAKVEEAIGREISGKFAKLPDKAATEDRAAVTAAVRGASQKAPEGKAPDYSKMSDGEFAKAVEGQHGYRPI